MKDYFSDLDFSAEINLDEYDYCTYINYRDQLIHQKEARASIEQILTGFIWDCMEGYENRNI